MTLITTQNIFDDTVSLGGGVEYSSPIVDVEQKGFSVAIAANQGGGNVEITLTLEAYNGPGTDWIPEPLAVFEAHPVGVAMKSRDNFTSAFGKIYRVVMTPTAGSGPVILDLGQ